MPIVTLTTCILIDTVTVTNKCRGKSTTCSWTIHTPTGGFIGSFFQETQYIRYFNW